MKLKRKTPQTTDTESINAILNKTMLMGNKKEPCTRGFSSQKQKNQPFYIHNEVSIMKNWTVFNGGIDAEITVRSREYKNLKENVHLDVIFT